MNSPPAAGVYLIMNIAAAAVEPGQIPGILDAQA
jgi:hypothetical protein